MARPASWPRLTWRVGGVLALLVAVLSAHALWADQMPWSAVFGIGAGIGMGAVLGAWLQRRQQLVLGRHHRDTAVVVQDIQTLRQAFDMLTRQVDATIHTSESAVMSMIDRVHRVHHNAQALQNKIHAAVGRSQALSSDSLSRAGQHGQAVAALAEHQAAVESTQAENQQRVAAVAGQVRQLTPLATLIADISRQTNLLAINASVEAARAGPEGAGFKTVAADVRRLSRQTADAARQIGEGIHQAATTIDAEMARAAAQQRSSAAPQPGEIAQHIQVLSDTLADVLPYLGELSQHMDQGMANIDNDVMDILAEMQFQDINRQLLQQINAALASLSDHFAQIYSLIDGQAPPPPMLLEELLSRWTDNDVVHARRVAHAQGTGQAGDAPPERAGAPTQGPAERALAGNQGARIEFF